MLSISCKKEPEESTNIPAGTTAYTLQHPAYFGKSYTIPSDNQMTNEAVDLGRHLFYDPILSKDKTVSCATCHQQKFGFSDPLALSVGVDGKTGTRHSMTIINSLWQDKFFWDGRTNSLEQQALEPIINPVEMNLPLNDAVLRLNGSAFYRNKFKTAYSTETITASLLANALAQFERTLISGNSKYDQYKRNEYTLTASEKRGLTLFYIHPEPSENLRGGNCGDCHSGFLTSDRGFHNNGLDVSFLNDQGLEEFTNLATDNGKFKTPTLRNIAVSAPYMHDGRFNNLEEVLDHYNEHIQPSATLDPLISLGSNETNGTSLALTAQEKKDIIAFLHLLTDDEFLNNPKFKSPFD